MSVKLPRVLVVAILAGVGLAGSIPLLAHHSFAATYFEDKTQTVEGDLVQFVFRNPHSFVHLEAPDEKGEIRRRTRGRAPRSAGRSSGDPACS